MGQRAVAAGAAFVAVLATATAFYLVDQGYRVPTSAAPPVVPEVRQFDLYLHTFEFGDRQVHHWMPPTVVVNAGDTVILRLHNADASSAHGFGLGAFNIAIPSVPPGQTVTVRFRATRPGVYHFGCVLTGCADDHGSQIGQFVVLGDGRL